MKNLAAQIEEIALAGMGLSMKTQTPADKVKSLYAEIDNKLETFYTELKKQSPENISSFFVITFPSVLQFIRETTETISIILLPGDAQRDDDIYREEY